MPIKDFSTFLSKITKYNRVNLGFDPSITRLLGHDPTHRQAIQAHYVNCCFLPTPMTLASGGGGESDVPACVIPKKNDFIS